MALAVSARIGALRTLAAPIDRRMPRAVALTISEFVDGLSWPASLCAYRIAATRRPMLDGLMPRVASAARNAATVSGLAGIAATRLGAHQAENNSKSDR